VVDKDLSTENPSLPTSSVKKSGFKKLKSLKELEDEIEKDLEIKDGHLIEKDSIKSNKPITRGHTVGVLTEFISKKSTTTEKMVFSSDFDLNDSLITFKLVNKVQLDIFNEQKQELVDFLRKKLENSYLECNAILTAEEVKAKPRTEQEKFESMAKKNPKIWDLKAALDLDLLF